MCLVVITRSRRKPMPKKAVKDIIVFKVIRNNRTGIFNNMFIDDKLQKWTKGYEYYETKPFNGSTWYHSSGRLHVGANCFHSKITKEDAEMLAQNYSNTKVVKMIIPKGTLYYKNDTDYASNRIIYPNWKV